MGVNLSGRSFLRLLDFSIEDTARVLGRMYDGIEFRGVDQEDVEQLDAKSGVPGWNGLTDLWHPTQMPADIPRHQHHHRCRDRREVRRHRDGGRGRGLRVPAVQGLRRG